MRNTGKIERPALTPPSQPVRRYDIPYVAGAIRRLCDDAALER
jgi:hypothetical protein